MPEKLAGQNVTAELEEATKNWMRLIVQARSDKNLKQRLIDTPFAVLQEYGISVREGLDIRVVENTDRILYLTLPASPELIGKELDAVVGGVDPTKVAAAVGNAVAQAVVVTVNILKGYYQVPGFNAPASP